MLIIANNPPSQSIIYSSTAPGWGQLAGEVTTNLVMLVPPTLKNRVLGPQPQWQAFPSQGLERRLVHCTDLSRRSWESNGISPLTEDIFFWGGGKMGSGNLAHIHNGDEILCQVCVACTKEISTHKFWTKDSKLHLLWMIQITALKWRGKKVQSSTFAWKRVN